MSLIKWI